MFRCLRPDLRIDEVCQLTPGQLRALGLDALLLDVDGTLKRYRDKEVPPRVAAWLGELAAAGVRLCLVSNGRPQRIGRFAAACGLPFVARAMKPLPSGCRRALRQLEVVAGQAAIVGDQVFADVLAGKLAGLRTILVRPIHPEDEPWFTRLKRPFERLLGHRAAAPPEPPADGEQRLGG